MSQLQNVERLLRRLVVAVRAIAAAMNVPVDLPDDGGGASPTYGPHGMSAPDENGGVRLESIDNAFRAEISGALDALNGNKAEDDPSRLKLASLFFVEEALTAFPNLTPRQVRNIKANTGRNAAGPGAIASRPYAVLIDDAGNETEAKGYVQTVGPTAQQAAEQYAKQFRDFVHNAQPGHEGDFEPRNGGKSAKSRSAKG